MSTQLPRHGLRRGDRSEPARERLEGHEDINPIVEQLPEPGHDPCGEGVSQHDGVIQGRATQFQKQSPRFGGDLCKRGGETACTDGLDEGATGFPCVVDEQRGFFSDE